MQTNDWSPIPKSKQASNYFDVPPPLLTCDRKR
jgi:hypothetical protein